MWAPHVLGSAIVLGAFFALPADARGALLALAALAAIALVYRHGDGSWRDRAWMSGSVLDNRFAPGALASARAPADRGTIKRGAPRSEARLRSIIESSDDIVFEFDEAATFVNVWASDESLLARPKAELLGRRAWEVLDPEFVAPFEEIFRRVLRSGRPESVEYPLEVEAGTRWFSARISPLREPDGTYVNVLMFTRDVTQRKELDRRVERLAAIVEATTDLVCLADTAGTVLYVNQAGRRMVGLDEEGGAPLLTLSDLVADSAREELVEEAIPRVVREGSWAQEMPLRARDGREIPASQVLLAHGADANPEYLSLVARDLTERHRFEQELRQSQKLEAIGGLAGGIAHDFNNLLSVVQGYAWLVMDELAQEDPARADLEEIVKAGERGAKLTRQLLAFSRQGAIAPKIVNINALVSDMHKLLSRAIRESIELTTDLSPRPWRTKVDPGQLEQVLLNLAVNAKDAMPDGGTLTIRTFNAEVDTDLAAVQPGVVPGRYVSVAVSDTGCGMSSELQERIFEPFFTTKPPGQGTGLGLASVYGIVKQAGGHVHVDSEAGRGSTFTIHLPAFVGDEEEPLSRMDFREELPSGRGETVLVAEDEDAVREAVARVLSGNGYRVLEARSGLEALELLGGHEDHPVDLLVTDAVMLGMSGAELADAAGLPTVYMSGYPNEVIARQGLLDEGIVLVHKPFSPGDLLQTVRRSLDHHAR